MVEDAAELLNQALKLPPEARAALADSLIDSLDTEVDENAEEASRHEIALRSRTRFRFCSHDCLGRRPTATPKPI
jgi:hypothetical protein